MPVNLRGKAYATVQERLAAAHGDTAQPAGIRSIETEIVATAPLLIVRAIVTFEDGRRFTGLSEAKLDAAANSADGTNPVECGETSAVGRALAFAGYYGSDQGIAGAEEMRTADRARTARPGPPPAPANAKPEKPVSVERVRQWYALARLEAIKAGIDAPELAKDAPDDFVMDLARRVRAEMVAKGLIKP